MFDCPSDVFLRNITVQRDSSTTQVAVFVCVPANKSLYVVILNNQWCFKQPLLLLNVFSSVELCLFTTSQIYVHFKQSSLVKIDSAQLN